MLLEERAGAVVVLTLNRPEARNALSPELMTALSHALRNAADRLSVLRTPRQSS